jgi:hypothetical protein
MSTRARRPAKPQPPPAQKPRPPLRTGYRDREAATPADRFNWRPNELVVGLPRASRKAPKGKDRV